MLKLLSLISSLRVVNPSLDKNGIRSPFLQYDDEFMTLGFIIIIKIFTILTLKEPYNLEDPEKFTQIDEKS